MNEFVAPSVMRAWARIARVKERLHSAVERDLKRQGLPPLEWYDVLLELSRAPNGRMPPKELEQAVLLAQYNLSRLLDRLGEKGLIRRVIFPGDKRRQLIAITAEGQRLREKMWPVYAKSIQQHAGSRLTEAEAEMLFILLGKLVESSHH
jgi:DNA-binding MarR family transcriptional regulator